MLPYLPRKERADNTNKSVVYPAFMPEGYGEIATEQFREELELPKKDDTDPKNDFVDYTRAAIEQVDEICLRYGWRAVYTYLEGRKEWLGRLVLSTANGMVQAFDHRRPELTQDIAKARVAEWALRWFEIWSISQTVDEPFLNRFNNTGKLVNNPNFANSKGPLLAFAQARYGENDPLIAHRTENLVSYKEYDEIIHIMKKSEELLKKYRYSRAIAEHAQAIVDLDRRAPSHGDKTWKCVVLSVMVQPAFDAYRKTLVPKDKPESFSRYKITEILQLLRKNPVTARFESITQPLVIFNLTDRESATSIGIHLAAVMLRVLPSDLSAAKVASICGYIVRGMQEISNRVLLDRVFTPPPDDWVPTTQPAQPTLSETRQLSAMNSIAQQLVRSWGEDSDEELHFCAFGMWVMLQREEYPRSTALAFQDGFQSECESRVENLIHRDAVESEVFYEDTGPSDMGTLDIPSKASILQLMGRWKKHQPVIAVPKKRKQHSIQEQMMLCLMKEPEDFPTKKDKEGICSICRTTCGEVDHDEQTGNATAF